MRRLCATIITILLIASVAGYSAGLFTVDYQREDSCAICRAIRISGRHYGAAYSRIEETPFTQWYRTFVDPRHGSDSEEHTHVWLKSGCTVVGSQTLGNVRYDASWIPALFLIRPEVEMELLMRLPDPETRAALVRSLNTPKRNTNVKRIRTLVEFYFVDQYKTPWPIWWKTHAATFGMPASLPQS